MRDVHPDWKASALGIVHLGRIQIGVGSALDRKVLIRITGPTDNPDDDIVVEAREGAVPDPRSCVWRTEYGESPVLLVMSSLRRRTSQAELNERATDAAQQLAGPIWTRAPERLRRYQRYAHAAAFDETRPRIIELARALAFESTAAWERFRVLAKMR